MDIYRSMEAEGVYTGNRQLCYSRLEYMFVSGYLVSSTTKVKVEQSYEQSDHSSLYVELHINEEIVMRQGLKQLY
jgi:endonuclease/exonuclease/phosphatase family metal-dependent hydrolase